MAKERPSNLARSSCADGKRVDPLAGNIAQGGVHQALALQAGNADKGLAFDLDGKVRLAAAVVAGMSVMVGAIVDDSKVGGRKGFAEKPLHFLFNRSGHVFHLEHHRPI